MKSHAQGRKRTILRKITSVLLIAVGSMSLVAGLLFGLLVLGFGGTSGMDLASAIHSISLPCAGISLGMLCVAGGVLMWRRTEVMAKPGRWRSAMGVSIAVLVTSMAATGYGTYLNLRRRAEQVERKLSSTTVWKPATATDEFRDQKVTFPLRSPAPDSWLTKNVSGIGFLVTVENNTLVICPMVAVDSVKGPQPPPEGWRDHIDELLAVAERQLEVTAVRRTAGQETMR